VPAALIDEFAAAATTAVGPEKVELEDEKQALEITMKGVEDSSAAAQAVLNDGGNADLMKQVMMMMAEMKEALDEVQQEVRVSSVTLGSIAMNEVSITLTLNLTLTRIRTLIVTLTVTLTLTLTRTRTRTLALTLTSSSARASSSSRRTRRPRSAPSGRASLTSSPRRSRIGTG